MKTGTQVLVDQIILIWMFIFIEITFGFIWPDEISIFLETRKVLVNFVKTILYVVGHAGVMMKGRCSYQEVNTNQSRADLYKTKTGEANWKKKNSRLNWKQNL